MLTMGNPGPAPMAKPADKSQAYDDFTFKAAAWTLTAHEGRPGHELQFAAMVERGVSLARSLFAFNSVNVEGWALYAESEMLPYEPPAGQFIAAAEPADARSACLARPDAQPGSDHARART